MNVHYEGSQLDELFNDAIAALCAANDAAQSVVEQVENAPKLAPRPWWKRLFDPDPRIFDAEQLRQLHLRTILSSRKRDVAVLENVTDCLAAAMSKFGMPSVTLSTREMLLIRKYARAYASAAAKDGQ